MRNEPVFLFDVDGTLTPHRQSIDLEFEPFLTDFIDRHNVCITSGSDLSKIHDQLGHELCDKFEYMSLCSGNETYRYGKCIKTSNWRLPEEIWQYLTECLEHATCLERTGCHFEQRTGMMNFSIIGRNADAAQRAAYVKWDNSQGYRRVIADHINYAWPDVTATIGGQISIDIYEKGKDKSQVLEYIKHKPILFFGDMIHEGGNDYTVARKIIDNKLGTCFQITNWKETRTILAAIDTALTNCS